MKDTRTHTRPIAIAVIGLVLILGAKIAMVYATIGGPVGSFDPFEKWYIRHFVFP